MHMSFYQIVLPIFTLLYLLQVFVIQSWLQYKKTGIKPYVFGNSDSAHDYCGRIYRFMILSTWISIGFYSFFQTGYAYLMPFGYLESEWLQHPGMGLALVAFIWIVIAQNQMAKSWRIGINYEEKTELVRHGLFSVSRNPVFLGVLVSYLGTFLVIPNALTFATLAVTFVTLQLQVRLEEDYLEKQHADDFLEYKSTVRRWI